MNTTLKTSLRLFLLRRLFDLSAAVCFCFVAAWRADFCCVQHRDPSATQIVNSELIVRYDRGDLTAFVTARKHELFGGFIPRGFRCTHYDETFPFRFMRATDGRSSQWLVGVPIFPLFALSAAVLAARGYRTIRRDWPRQRELHRLRRLRSQHQRLLRARRICQHCDYDLRATPDRCPECGHVPPSPIPIRSGSAREMMVSTPRRQGRQVQKP